MKLLLSAFVLVLSFSTHQQAMAQAPVNPRFPASDADEQDLTKSD